MANHTPRTDCPAGCEWTFITKGGMKNHLKNKHPGWGMTDQSMMTWTYCILCHAPFKKLPDLLTHVRTHGAKL